MWNTYNIVIYKLDGLNQLCDEKRGVINSGFCSIKRLRVLLSPPPPLDGMLVHRRATPSSKFAGTHLYT